MSAWYQKKIGGVLLDISGVLIDSGVAIPGSVEAVKRLRSAGLPVRFCTNDTTTVRIKFVEKLRKAGFELKEEEVFPPIPAVCKILQQRGLRPFLLCNDDCKPDFDCVDQTNPNCVVLGDADTHLTYDKMNKAFQLLKSLEKPIFFSLGKGKYDKEDGQYILDIGPFMKALEYACDIEAEVVGKPEPAFFNIPLQDMGVTPDMCVMVGDDIMGDVGGAQSTGMRGVLVRTGKYSPSDENHPSIKPDGIVDNLAQAVDLILSGQS